MVRRTDKEASATPQIAFLSRLNRVRAQRRSFSDPRRLPSMVRSRAFDPRFKVIHELMGKKVRDILLIATPYDAWIMEEEEGRLSEQITNEYQGLNLSHPPRLTWVASLEDALSTLAEHRFDLVVIFTRSSETDPESMGRAIKRQKPDLISDVRRFLLQHLGFGDFVFKGENGEPIARARNLRELEAALREVPPPSASCATLNKTTSPGGSLPVRSPDLPAECGRFEGRRFRTWPATRRSWPTWCAAAGWSARWGSWPASTGNDSTRTRSSSAWAAVPWAARPGASRSSPPCCTAARNFWTGSPT
ncbi:MAG: hypothetical protein ACLFOY_00050 [Desulfatibacillaceae bacterium]